MANKRIVKKNIHRLCGALAAELLSAASCIDGFDGSKVPEVVGRIAQLQVNSLAHCSFSFDKAPTDFADARAFNSARRRYNRSAFARLQADIETETSAILKEMNAMLPQAARDAVKSAAGK